jgi:ParB family chromosome partitioning protein
VNELKLGRGISDLIEENEIDVNLSEEVLDIEISLIRPNPEQPRTVFNPEKLEELCESIKEHGVIQPVILKPAASGYILVAGERRVKACELAGMTTVPSIIREYNAIYLSELAILENLQREDLTSIEEAIAFERAIYNLKLTHEELGKKIGKSRVYVTNILGLLNLPKTVIDDVNLGKISMGHARALSKLKDNELCIRLRDKIIDEQLTVRDIESLIRNINNKDSGKIIPQNVLDKTRKTLKKLVSSDIKYKINKNNISFSFSNEDELEKIVKFLNRRK